MWAYGLIFSIFRLAVCWVCGRRHIVGECFPPLKTPIYLLQSTPQAAVRIQPSYLPLTAAWPCLQPCIDQNGGKTSKQGVALVRKEKARTSSPPVQLKEQNSPNISARRCTKILFVYYYLLFIICLLLFIIYYLLFVICCLCQTCLQLARPRSGLTDFPFIILAACWGNTRQTDM